MTIHDLKTWPEPFRALLDGRKTYEVRRCERSVALGDLLVLREWLPNEGSFTGRLVLRSVVHITPGLPAGLTVLGLEPVFPAELEAYRQKQVPQLFDRDFAGTIKAAGGLQVGEATAKPSDSWEGVLQYRLYSFVEEAAIDRAVASLEALAVNLVDGSGKPKSAESLAVSIADAVDRIQIARAKTRREETP